MRIAALLIAMSLLGACATMKTHSDRDPAADFSRFQTFTWIADDPVMAPPDSAAQVSPLNRRRIVEAVEAELAAKGYRKAEQRGTADFVVSFTVGSRDRISVFSHPEPYGGPWNWGWRYFGNDVDVQQYTEGRLAVDIFDTRSHQPVWHGWASKDITQRDVDAAGTLIPQAVKAILKDFPQH